MARYRRLPGARRGLINGSSVWMGTDHLLLVKSMRFREEYKRFHLRDVQAIAIAKAPRFHISTRAMTIGAAWLTAMAALPRFRPYLWVAAALLVLAWLVVSAYYSCRCRVYTAVSSDELPSVYRVWTAKKFLAAVEPKIGEVQGVLEGEWAEAAETRDIGLPLAPAPTAQMPGASPRDRQPAPVHTVLTDNFVAVLFASGLSAFLLLNASAQSTRWVAIAFMVLKVALAVAIFVQHYKGKVAGGMQKVAIATLLVMGIMYYAEQFSASFAAASSVNKRVQIAPVIVSGNRLTVEVNAVASLLLGCAGLGIIFFARESREP